MFCRSFAIQFGNKERDGCFRIVLVFVCVILSRLLNAVFGL